MSPIFNLKVDDQATPFVARLTRVLQDRTQLNKRMVDRAEVLTRNHITRAARTRHKTATLLGARRTGYLEGKAALVESRSDASGATLTVVGDIFARADGPVLVRPKTRKFLAIPAHKSAYGKRPGEFPDLKLIVLKSGGKKRLALVKADQTNLKTRRRSGFEYDRSKGRAGIVYFWLVKQARLPHDPGLLPMLLQYQGAMEQGAKDFFNLDL